jgi:hypothetical protein
MFLAESITNKSYSKLKALAITVRVLWYVLAFLFVFSYLVLSAPPARKFWGDADQGVQLSIAQQIINGMHPFVDMAGGGYGPLVFYGSALGQYVSGYRLVGEVAVIVLGYALAYMLLFYLSIRLSKSWVLSAILLVFLVFLMPRFYKYYIVLAPAATATALYVYLGSQKSSGIVALAFGVAITGMYRLDFGFHALVVSSIAIFLKQKGNIRLACKDFGRLTLSGLVFAFPWLLFLALKGNLIHIFCDIVVNSTQLSSGLALPAPRFDFRHGILSQGNLFPFQFWFVFSIPLMAVGLMAFRWRVIEDNEKYFVICVSLFSIMIFSQALHRSDYPHFLQVIALSFVIAGWMIRNLCEIILSKKLSFWGFVSCLTLAVFVWAESSFIDSFHKTNPIPIRQKLGQLPEKINHYLLSRSELRDLFRQRSRRHWKRRVVDYVYNNTSEKDYVLFLPFVPQLYYFSERSYETPAGVFFPGMFPTTESQVNFTEKMANTSLVVDLPGLSFDGRPERNARYYAPKIMEHIYRNYKRVKRFGPANVLVRK